MGDEMHTYVIFDMDGTLYDLYQPFERACKQVLQDRVPDDRQLQQIFMASRRHSDALRAKQDYEEKELVILRNEAAFLDHHISLKREVLEAIQEAYAYYQKHLYMEEGMKEILLLLKKRKVRLALISNGDENHQRQKAIALGVDAYIRREHQFFSGMIGIDKPDIRLFRWVEKQLQIKKEDHVYYIGDSYASDILGAHQAGWKTIWSHIYLSEQPQSISFRGDMEVDDMQGLQRIFLQEIEEGKEDAIERG